MSLSSFGTFRRQKLFFFYIYNEHFQRTLFRYIPPSMTHGESLLYVEVPSLWSVVCCLWCDVPYVDACRLPHRPDSWKQHGSLSFSLLVPLSFFDLLFFSKTHTHTVTLTGSYIGSEGTQLLSIGLLLSPFPLLCLFPISFNIPVEAFLSQYEECFLRHVKYFLKFPFFSLYIIMFLVHHQFS